MSPVKSRSKRVPDGRWTVAFGDEERAAYAARMVEEYASSIYPPAT